MPRGDGTGPMGRGPMTGRRAGFCSWLGAPGYTDAPPAFGLGYGRGRGFRSGGRGWRNRFFASGFWGWMRPAGYGAPYQIPDPEMEKQMLKREADALKAELSDLQKRLDELESAKAAE
ncbi:DUF5320 domain-containing protein [Syntrophus buswellii]|uniref:DUF5320 domain-containing protein n=1 Tax=Syntrophus TaxID=43773 RepID=UPI0009C94708|nr:MAG: hypothetical protein A4E69_02721 [Syntrophus sp. PtaB.Bin138]